MPCDQIFHYIFFIEGLFYLHAGESHLQQLFSNEKAKSSRNMFKKLLKFNESNIGLWVLYAEIEFYKSIY